MKLYFYSIILLLATICSTQTITGADTRIVNDTTDTPIEYIDKIVRFGANALPPDSITPGSLGEFYIHQFLNFVTIAIEHTNALVRPVEASPTKSPSRLSRLLGSPRKIKDAIFKAKGASPSFDSEQYIAEIFDQDRGVGRYLLLRSFFEGATYSVVEKITKKLQACMLEFCTPAARSIDGEMRIKLNKLKHSILRQYFALEKSLLEKAIVAYNFQMLTRRGVGQLKTIVNQVIFSQYIQKFSIPLLSILYHCERERESLTSLNLIAQWKSLEEDLLYRTEHAIHSLTIWIPLAQDIRAWANQIGRQILMGFEAYEMLNTETIEALQANLATAQARACETCQADLTRFALEPQANWRTTDFGAAIADAEIITAATVAAEQARVRGESASSAESTEGETEPTSPGSASLEPSAAPITPSPTGQAPDDLFRLDALPEPIAVQ